ncbi:MAG: hypothetical protein Q4C96_10690 [Planctomycetia bacterium]|nr:hypothetical protein [Planctomycetia bacterium]
MHYKFPLPMSAGWSAGIFVTPKYFFQNYKNGNLKQHQNVTQNPEKASFFSTSEVLQQQLGHV